MSDDLERRIDAFLSLADRTRTAEPPERRESMQRILVRRAGDLVHQRDDLAVFLTQGDDYLNDAPDDPDFIANEDIWIERLHEYEAICDALDEGARRWLREVA